MKHNDNERRLWVQNDEILYHWMRFDRHYTKETERNWIRRNRAAIDSVIDKTLNPRQR